VASALARRLDPALTGHLFQNPGNSGKATEQLKDFSRLH